MFYKNSTNFYSDKIIFVEKYITMMSEKTRCIAYFSEEMEIHKSEENASKVNQSLAFMINMK